MARLKLIKTPNDDNRKLLAIQPRELKKLIRTKKRQWEINRIQDIETNLRQMKKCFLIDAMKEKTGFKPRMTIL